LLNENTFRISIFTIASCQHPSNKQVRMQYGTGTGGRCCMCAGQTLRIHSPGGSTYMRKMTHGHHRESATSHRKPDSVNRYVFTWRIILTNFIPIQFETTQPYSFLKIVAPTRRRTTARWVATLDQKITQQK